MSLLVNLWGCVIVSQLVGVSLLVNLWGVPPHACVYGRCETQQRHLHEVGSLPGDQGRCLRGENTLTMTSLHQLLLAMRSNQGTKSCNLLATRCTSVLESAYLLVYTSAGAHIHPLPGRANCRRAGCRSAAARRQGEPGSTTACPLFSTTVRSADL